MIDQLGNLFGEFVLDGFNDVVIDFICHSHGSYDSTMGKVPFSKGL